MTGDSEKARINGRRRGISILQAETVVDGPSAKTRYDVLPSLSEPRFMTVGWSSLGRLLVEVTSEGGPRPRIISARRATKRERNACVRR
jgi:uncharacterized DUF497 family protein